MIKRKKNELESQLTYNLDSEVMPKNYVNFSKSFNFYDI